VATFDNFLYVNSEETGWDSYSGSLPAFRHSVTLGATQTFPIYAGSLFKRWEGVMHIFYAYLIPEEAPIFYGNHFQLTISTTAQKLQQLMDEKIAENEIPGAIMAVMIPDEGKWIGTSGVSELEKKTKMQPHDRFRVASITKTFTALTILQLAQEEKLGLDDTLEQWLPGVVCGQETKDCSYVCDDKNCNFEPAKITLRMLLTHFSGIENFTHDVNNWVIPSLAQPDKVLIPTELVNLALAFGPLSEQGTKWSYANTNYVLLGLVIEKLTGSTWEDEVRNRFVEPLELTNTIIPKIGEATLSEPYARGYIDLFEQTGGAAGEEGVIVEHSVQDPGFTWSSGDMISTPENLMYWIKHVAEGDLLDDTYQQEMLTFIVDPSVDGLEMGLGIISDLNDDVIGHIGQLSGYDCTAQYQPTHAIPISVCANRTLAASSPKNVQVLMVGDALAIITGEDKPESRSGSRYGNGNRSGIWNGTLNEY
jgi:D-alanyl-D-alanine carboxypeptidase